MYAWLHIANNPNNHVYVHNIMHRNNYFPMYVYLYKIDTPRKNALKLFFSKIILRAAPQIKLGGGAIF